MDMPAVSNGSFETRNVQFEASTRMMAKAMDTQTQTMDTLLENLDATRAMEQSVNPYRGSLYDVSI